MLTNDQIEGILKTVHKCKNIEVIKSQHKSALVSLIVFDKRSNKVNQLHT